MTAEQLFARHAALRAIVAADLDNLAALRTVAERSTSQYSVVVSNHTPGSRGRLEDDVFNIIEEEEKLKGKIASLDKLEKEILELIRLVPNARQRAVLLMRNLQGLTLTQIAKKLDIGHTTAWDSYVNGMNTIETIMREKEKEGNINESDADISQ